MHLEFIIETLTHKHNQSCSPIGNAELYKSIGESIAGCILLQPHSAPSPNRINVKKLSEYKIIQTWRAHFNDYFTVAHVHDSLNFGLPMNSSVIKIRKIGLSDLTGILKTNKTPSLTNATAKNYVRPIKQHQPQRAASNNLGKYLQCHSVKLFTPSHFNPAPTTHQRRNLGLNPYKPSYY